MASRMFKRLCSSVAEFNHGRTFFKEELAALNNRLVADVGDKGDVVSGGNLVLLTGPKDSGKSGLLREFMRRQHQGIYPGVSCIADMRAAGSLTPKGVANLLKSTFILLLDKMSVSGRVSSAFANLEGQVKLEMERAHDMDAVLAAIEAYAMSWRSLIVSRKEQSYAAAYPTVIIDEANGLQDWATDTATKKDLEQMLDFFVKVTKHHLVNVVLASSKNFFETWVEGYIGKLRHKTINIGDLAESEARSFLEWRLPKKNSGGVSDDLWKDIYHYTGGRMGFLAIAARSLKDWEAQKTSLLSFYRMRVQLACDPDALHALPANKHGKLPCWTKNDWMTAVSTLVEQRDGIMPYVSLCRKLSVEKVNSLIEYDQLHYRQLTDWGNDIQRKKEDWPLVMPSSMVHFRAMQEVADKLDE